MSYSCNVDRHGTYHIEMDLSYPLPSGQRESKYAVDVYIYTPTTLGLTRERYSVAGFLHDVKSYTRCDLCALPVSKMLDPDCTISPLRRLDRMLKEMTTENDLSVEKATYEIKTLVNLHHDALRDLRELFKEQMASRLPDSGAQSFIDDYLEDHRCFVLALRAFYPRLVDPRVPDVIRQSLRLADEATSIKAEKEMHHLARMIEHTPSLAPRLTALEAAINDEQSYRRRMNYPSVAGPEFSEQNEDYVYRESNLKKWAQSSTYMTVAASKSTAHMSQVIAGFAAALAMAFAVAAAIIAQTFYDMNSLPWAILIVFSYILKDRIKELVRNALINLVPTLVADRVVRLTNPRGGDDAGRCRERVRFFTSDHAPSEVREMRNHNSDYFRSLMPPEQVIQYSKVVMLRGGEPFKNLQRVVGIKELIRINLHTWLHQMDDSVDELFTYENGQRKLVKTARVYHINMIIRLTENLAGESKAMFKYRVLLTRNGIKRVERVG